MIPICETYVTRYFSKNMCDLLIGPRQYYVS